MQKVSLTAAQPLDDRVVVKPDTAEEVSAGGIIIPATAQEKLAMGTVLRVGPGKLNLEMERVPMQVAPGDYVAYGKYSGTELTIDGTTVMVLRQDEILMVWAKPKRAAPAADEAA